MATNRYRRPRIYTRSDAIASLTDTAFTVALQLHKDKIAKDIRQGDREYAATVSMYQDAKSEAKNAQKLYDETKLSWQEHGLSLNSLDELSKTTESLRVLNDINEIPARDFKARADYYSDKAYNLDVLRRIAQNKLFGDIRKAKNIMLGGGGPEVTGDTGEKAVWEKSDLGVQAYKSIYGEMDGLVEEYYKANKGAIQASLDKLIKGELDRSILSERLRGYQGKTTGQAQTDLQQKRDMARTHFMTDLRDADITSGLSEYNSSVLLEQTYLSNQDTKGVEKQQKVQADRINDIGYEMAILTGETNLNPEKIGRLFKDYKRIHRLAQLKRGPYKRIDIEPTFDPYWNLIEKAYERYSATQDAGSKSMIQDSARNLFGFGQDLSFDEFYANHKEYKTQFLLAPFKKNDILPSDQGDILPKNDPDNTGANPDNWFDAQDFDFINERQ